MKNILMIILGLFLVISDISNAQNFCLKFQRSLNSYVNIPDGTNLSNFTVEMWIKFNSIPVDVNGVRIFSRRGGGAFNDALLLDATNGPNRGKLYTYVWDNSAKVVTSSTVVDTLRWYHVALVAASNGQVKLFINGISEGTPVSIGQIQQVGTFYRLSATDEPLPGVDAFIDELRISNIARYSSNFTPPAQQFVTDANTRILYHFNEGIGAITYDSSGNNINGTLNGATWSANVPSYGLVAYYPFSGNAADSSGNSNHGTVFNATLTNDRFGNPNSAYYFNGVSGYIQVTSSNSLKLTNNFTLSAYVYADTFKTGVPVEQHGVISKINAGDWFGGYEMRTGAAENPSGNFEFTSNFGGNNVYITKGPYLPKKWYLVTTTYDNVWLKLYVNGICLDSQSRSGSAQISDIPLSIGRRGGANMFHKGIIDEVRIYNRALSSAEVLQLYDISQPISADTTTRWLMQVKSQISTVYDNENFAGVADSATEGFDSRFDLPEPPPAPGNYISAYFSHPEWGVITGSDFARDIKKNTNVTDTVKRWFFFVKTNVLNDSVKLTFLKDRIPSSLGKYLTDLSTGQRINLKTISEYKYYNTSATARQFELIIGDSTVPSLTMLYPLGSNIFRSGTTKNINWTTSDGTGIDSVLIYKSTDAGTNYSFLKSVGFSQST
ncbi:MAG: LamG domain-containing protein, partial [Ignavibacteriae bacterium]|nr:LamG domain-containing protein [Ignavibacteriota bacterium]